MKHRIHRLLALSVLALALGGATAQAQTFFDDYEGDLSAYSTYSGQIVEDPLQPGNHVLSFYQVRGGGDAFGPWMATTPGQDMVLTFDYLGDPNAGDPDGLNLGGFIGVTWSGGENWLGGTGGWPSDLVLIDDGQWHSYSIPFTAEAAQIRVFIEDWDTFGSSIPGDAYFDNVRIEPAAPTDSDGDGVNDGSDNCPSVANADQTDTDGSGQGDACDEDDDNDGDPDASDNCPFTANASQADLDGDGLGDPCDADPDGDGATANDNCPVLPNAAQTDTDGDGAGDDCDTDDDGDGVCDDATGGCTGGLIARWSLNGDATDSFAAHDGSAGGTVTWVAGHSGQALHVAGDGYLEGHIPSLPQGAAPRTFAAWIWIDQAHQGTIFNYGTFAANQRAGMLYISGRLYWVGEHNDVIGNTSIPIGEWAHVAITYDSASVIRLYVNGQLDRTQAISPHATAGTGWRIGNGADINYFREAFQGRIDDVSVYDRALSDDEIAALHDGTCSDCSGGPDNCPTTVNVGQADLDGDSIGDACEADTDGDGIDDDDDTCPLVADASNDDTDDDGSGDACDFDDDNDGVPDAADNCALIANGSQSDVDGDGDGDACDADLDGDGVANGTDNCADVANSAQADFDGDGAGDACDGDIDGDGVTNAGDSCASTPAGEDVLGSGCSVDQLCPCAGPQGSSAAWRNHGKYVSCVAGASNQFVAAGLMTQAERDAKVSEAGQSGCGR